MDIFQGSSRFSGKIPAGRGGEKMGRNNNRNMELESQYRTSDWIKSIKKRRKRQRD